MRHRNAQQAARTCVVLIAIVGMATVVVAQEKKEIPDHTGFKSCETCHADKQSMWEASGHSKSIGRVANSPQASADCYGCHSTEGVIAKREGQKVDLAAKASFHSVSCLACHEPRATAYPHKLALDPDKLCESCHSQRIVLQGHGAKGIEDIRSVHSEVACASCHMTRGDHSMKVLRPDDPNLAENRTDTCTACHRDGNRKARAQQLQEWQADYKKSMDPLQADLTAVNAALKDKPNLLSAELKAKLDALKQNLFILQRDSSQGFHNPDFASEVIKEVQAALK